MLLKLFYLIQNSSKNLIRTKGIISTFILSTLLFTISFFSFYIFLFLGHTHQQMIQGLEKEVDPIEIQMSAVPLMAMSLFKIASFLICMILIFLAIASTKKSFTQFLITQKKDYKIMSLIGESILSLKLFFSFQITIFSILPILLGYFIGQLIFYKSVIETMQIGISSDSINNFNGNYVLSILIILFSILYIFISSFIFSGKKIQSFIFV